ncbi:MAG: hypothetical protein WAM82_03655 [Thermoanaerobaculia bacterium]
MIEFQRQGVKSQPVQPEALAEKTIVLSLAVADVADQRMADVLEVTADLVQAPGQRPRLYQGIALEDGEPPVLGHRRHPRSARRSRHG